MGKKIKASVVIPTYNAQSRIAETLNALNKQTKKNFEVVLVDDGSTDDTYKAVKNFKAMFPLRIIRQENRGPACARNKGANNARGEILIFMDSDCVPKKDFIDEILSPFSNPQVAGVQGEYETKNKDKIIARYVGYEIFYRHERMSNLKRIDHVATYACAYRKRDFGKGFATCFKKANMEDTEFSYRLAEKGKLLVFQPKAIVLHPHPSGLSRFLKQQYIRGYWRALGHKLHPEKLLNDSYMGPTMFIQGTLSLLFFASLFLSIILYFIFFKISVFALPIIAFLLLIMSNIFFGFFCRKYEKKMVLIAPTIASFRSLLGTAGFLIGAARLRITRKLK